MYEYIRTRFMCLYNMCSAYLFTLYSKMPVRHGSTTMSNLWKSYSEKELEAVKSRISLVTMPPHPIGTTCGYLPDDDLWVTSSGDFITTEELNLSYEHKLHVKDIDKDKILRWLSSLDGCATWGEGYSMPTVRDCMLDGTPDKLQLAVMRNLIKKELVSGCACGCRGDFEITDKGREKILQKGKAVKKYRKKPLVIEAVQIKHETWQELKIFLSSIKAEFKNHEDILGVAIPTLEGVMVGAKDDYIIKGAKGEFYPCKPDIFEATYEKVEGDV